MPKSLYIDPVKVREPGYIHFEDIPVCQYNKTIKQELEEGNYTKEDLIRIYRDMASAVSSSTCSPSSRPRPTTTA